MSGEIDKNEIMLNTRFNFVNNDDDNDGSCNVALYRTL